MKPDPEPFPYEDILHLSRPVSASHPQMSMAERAAQFSPFAALTGYGDLIRETARPLQARPELTEEEKERLDLRLREIFSQHGADLSVSVTYFSPDRAKSGGICVTVSGQIQKIDPAVRRLILKNGLEISLDEVLELEILP